MFTHILLKQTICFNSDKDAKSSRLVQVFVILNLKYTPRDNCMRIWIKKKLEQKMNNCGLHGYQAETASRVCPVVFAPATSTSIPAINPVTAMKLKPTAKENAVTITGSMIAPNAPPT